MSGAASDGGPPAGRGGTGPVITAWTRGLALAGLIPAGLGLLVIALAPAFLILLGLTVLVLRVFDPGGAAASQVFLLLL